MFTFIETKLFSRLADEYLPTISCRACSIISMMVLDSLIGGNRIEPMIVVMPDASNPGGAWYTDSPTSGSWEQFVVQGRSGSIGVDGVREDACRPRSAILPGRVRRRARRRSSAPVRDVGIRVFRRVLQSTMKVPSNEGMNPAATFGAWPHGFGAPCVRAATASLTSPALASSLALSCREGSS
jgi:hypothetical protein